MSSWVTMVSGLVMAEGGLLWNYQKPSKRLDLLTFVTTKVPNQAISESDEVLDLCVLGHEKIVSESSGQEFSFLWAKTWKSEIPFRSECPDGVRLISTGTSGWSSAISTKTMKFWFPSFWWPPVAFHDQRKSHNSQHKTKVMHFM